jgi:hypothetical protein
MWKASLLELNILYGISNTTSVRIFIFKHHHCHNHSISNQMMRGNLYKACTHLMIREGKEVIIKVKGIVQDEGVLKYLNYC